VELQLRLDFEAEPTAGLDCKETNENILPLPGNESRPSIRKAVAIPNELHRLLKKSKKVRLSPKQAVEAYRVERFYDSQMAVQLSALRIGRALLSEIFVLCFWYSFMLQVK
jgi:hypothetical protein